MSNLKNLFKAEDFINLTELPLGDAKQQAEQIAERCQELLEQYGFKEFIAEYTAEFELHRTRGAVRSYSKRRAG